MDCCIPRCPAGFKQVFVYGDLLHTDGDGVWYTVTLVYMGTYSPNMEGAYRPILRQLRISPSLLYTL